MKQVPPNSKLNQLSSFESAVLATGVERLAGVDEVGRGCLAGPVVAACLILEQGQPLPAVADSKQLKPEQRLMLSAEIKQTCLAWAIAEVSPQDIDRMNIHHASLLAMQRAVEQLSPRPDYLLIDGRFVLDVSITQEAIVRGDATCQVIGAASILAKVWRDQLMEAMEQRYPEFGFGQHKGYGTKQHRDELRRHGPTPLHRRSFNGVLNSPLF